MVTLDRCPWMLTLAVKYYQGHDRWRVCFDMPEHTRIARSNTAKRAALGEPHGAYLLSVFN